MTIEETINDIKKRDRNNPQIYVCSKTRLSTRQLKQNDKGELGYITFLMRNFAKDIQKELNKECIGIDYDKAEYSTFTFNLKETGRGFLNVYYLQVDRLSRNNKGNSKKIGEELIKPNKKVRFTL